MPHDVCSAHAVLLQDSIVRTLLGRTRPLPGIKSDEYRLRGNAERAAINTPIQVRLDLDLDWA